MMGEELNAVEITERGLLGDRAYALVDPSTGKVASAKNPRKWPHLFDFRAAFLEPPRTAAKTPSVRISLPDGATITSEQSELNETLSRALGREVKFTSAVPETPTLEEYWPDLEGLNHQDAVTDESIPPGAFFDGAAVHLLTTASIARLQEAYPKGRFEVRRFRPNIVVEPAPGEEGFVENAWIGHTLAIGPEVRLSVSGPCPRCVMPTLAQGDLPEDSGILRTALEENEGRVGVYAKVVRGGTVRRGDRLSMSEDTA
jgi:hypothetical protein